MDALMDCVVRRSCPLGTLVVRAGSWCLLARLAWDVEAQEPRAGQPASRHEDLYA